eukprot:CAMPEP_0178963132 /NCGR_PEP_ID=MMETSP0789-20121207/14826_1 /TAXON_ID=3005 /ORGANISM="Rhizosolenia setigera, Strain CCMP 1694" /LENGTH=127 /DNA_ID=CAMNT_0020647511 /DNA_START=50 /DNA_END=433 /DNA_ORIENTATION=+
MEFSEVQQTDNHNSGNSRRRTVRSYSIIGILRDVSYFLCSIFNPVVWVMEFIRDYNENSEDLRRIEESTERLLLRKSNNKNGQSKKKLETDLENLKSRIDLLKESDEEWKNFQFDEKDDNDVTPVIT